MLKFYIKHKWSFALIKNRQLLKVRKAPSRNIISVAMMTTHTVCKIEWRYSRQNLRVLPCTCTWGAYYAVRKFLRGLCREGGGRGARGGQNLWSLRSDTFTFIINLFHSSRGATPTTPTANNQQAQGTQPTNQHKSAFFIQITNLINNQPIDKIT